VPTIRTDRLILRPWRDDDIAPWAAMNADPAVREFWPDRLTRSQAAEQVEAFAGDLERRGWGWWAVEVAATGRFAGMAGIDPTDDDAPFDGIETGWRLARDAWGHGYATEAARAAVDHGFDQLGLSEIYAIAVAGNERSFAVMRRLGMTPVPSLDFDDPSVSEPRLRRCRVYRIGADERAFASGKS
jgi:RimJ/RimL family protein N-acetyltransferase